MSENPDFHGEESRALPDAALAEKRTCRGRYFSAECPDDFFDSWSSIKRVLKALALSLSLTRFRP